MISAWNLEKGTEYFREGSLRVYYWDDGRCPMAFSLWGAQIEDPVSVKPVYSCATIHRDVCEGSELLRLQHLQWAAATLGTGPPLRVFTTRART